MIFEEVLPRTTRSINFLSKMFVVSEWQKFANYSSIIKNANPKKLHLFALWSNVMGLFMSGIPV